jgi:hypothetical protein
VQHKLVSSTVQLCHGTGVAVSGVSDGRGWSHANKQNELLNTSSALLGINHGSQLLHKQCKGLAVIGPA